MTNESSRRAFEHGMNCSANNPHLKHECTCGLEWRIKLCTEQEMHNAWRKWAEEAEALLKARDAEIEELTENGQAMVDSLKRVNADVLRLRGALIEAKAYCPEEIEAMCDNALANQHGEG